MRRGNLLLLVLVIFAAGGLGYLAGKRIDPVPPAAHDRPLDYEEYEDVPAPPSLDLPSLGDALAQIPVPEWEPGDGEITGHVRKDTGGPLAGVLIGAHAIRNTGKTQHLGRPEPEKSLEHAVREAVLDHHWRRATRATTTTGPDGSYRLESLVHAYYYITAHARGFQVWAAGGAGRCWPGESVDLVARACSLLSIAVLGPDGREVGEARIECRQPGGGVHSSTWASSARTIQLSPARYEVVALANSGEWKSDPVDVDLTGIGKEAEATLTLKAVPGLRIRLVRPEGEPSGFQHLRAMRVEPGETPDPRELLTSGLRSDHWTGTRDVFLFPDLAPGEWYVGVFADNALVESVRVTVVDRIVDAGLVLPKPDPSEHLVVNVVGPDGEPVTDANVSTGYRHKNGSSSGGGGVVTLDEGRFRVRHREVDEDRKFEDFRRFVTVTSRSLGSREVEYDSEADREITVRFEAAAYVTVSIAGYEGSGYEGRFRIGVFRESDNRMARATQTWHSPAPSSEGRQKFGPVSPGEYRVNLQLLTSEHESLLVQETFATLRAGDNEVTVAIPALHPLAVLVDGVADGVRASLREIGGRGRWRMPGAVAKDGRLSWADLPPGEYEVSIRGKGTEGRMRVKVPGPSEVRFVKEVRNAVLVSVTDAAGLLGQAGFRDGDLIIGMEGAIFKSEMQVQASFRLAMTTERSRLLVLRNGKRIDLAVDLSSLAEKDHEEMGGRIHPATRPE